MTRDTSLSIGRRRILDHLKLSGPATSAELASALSLTAAAVRQHLDKLAAEDLVASIGTGREPGAGRGRPPGRWRLTRRAHRLFPDRHGELTAQLVEAIHQVAGAEVLDAVIAARTESQRADYATAIAAGGQSLREKAASLARRRTAEGYMAEVVPLDPADDGAGLLLIEHHCPICEAAESCLGFCRAELDLFRTMLGSEVAVERAEHLLAGGGRCVYRLRPVAAGGSAAIATNDPAAVAST